MTMGVRLVLGSGPLSRAVLDLADDPGRPSDLLLVTDDPHTIEMYADSGDVIPGDPTDPAALRAIDGPITGAIVAEPDPARHRSIVRLLTTLYPDVPIVSTGEPAATVDGGPGTALEDTGATVVDPAAVTASSVVEAVGTEPAELAFHLRRVLAVLPEPLGVIAHDNPDPDAIASAVALVRVAEANGVSAEAGYFGDITHQQNRAMVNVLDLDLAQFDEPDAADRYASLALVDHASPGVNDQLPPDAEVAIVIDHHPAYETAPAAHVDRREEVGATSTLLAEYLEHLAVSPGSTLATALLLGIQTDTDDYIRGAARLDFQAVSWLLEHADLDRLERIQSPTMSGETLDTIARAIGAADVRNGILTSCVGRIRDRDALPQAADRLIAREDVRAALVYGFDDETIYLSGRAAANAIDIGELVRDAFAQIGSAGGHARMAGGQLPIGMLRPGDEEAGTDLSAVVRSVVDDRFRDAVSRRKPEPLRGGIDRRWPDGP